MSPKSTTGLLRPKGTGSVKRGYGGRWFWRPPQVTVNGVRFRSHPHGPYDFKFQAERALAKWLEEHKETTNDSEQALGSGAIAGQMASEDMGRDAQSAGR